MQPPGWNSLRRRWEGAETWDSRRFPRRLTESRAKVRDMNEANGSGRILVVDDEPSIVDAVATALRYEGFEVREEGTGRGAITAVADFEPDLVVLDWMLPGPRRDRGRPAAPRAGLQDRDPLPHRQGRGREQGRGAARGRRRLRDEAVQPRRGRRARAGHPAPHGGRPAGRRPPLRRRDARRGAARGAPRRARAST